LLLVSSIFFTTITKLTEATVNVPVLVLGRGNWGGGADTGRARAGFLRRGRLLLELQPGPFFAACTATLP
jgi:hypothetical protein